MKPPDPKTAGAKVLVTGATGFVGGAVCRELVGRGYDVHGLVRATSNWQPLAELGVQVHIGNLDDFASVRAAASGADLVVHAGALAADWGSKTDFYAANVTGTHNVLTACQEAGVQRLIHFSTVDVFGHTHGRHYDEDCPLIPSSGWYSRTKIIAETALRAAMQDGRSPGITIVYPAWIYGEGDRVFLPDLLASMRDRTFMYFRNGGEHLIGLVYIGNLMEALRIIISSTKAVGGRYIVSDEPAITFRSLVSLLAEREGIEPPSMGVPYHLAYAGSALLEVGARLLRRKERLLSTRQVIRTLGCSVTYDSSRIRALGYRQRYRLPGTLDWLANADPVVSDTAG